MNKLSMVLVVAAACGGASGPAHDLAVPPDLTPTLVNLTGKWASDVVLTASDGSKLEVHPLWNASEPITPDANGNYEVDSRWELCDLTIPTSLAVPYDDAGLAQLGWNAPSGSIAGEQDGAPFTQPAVPLVGGAVLKDGVNDPLPTNASVTCSSTVLTGCVTVDMTSGLPGVRVPATGLTPDADVLYMDFRLLVAFNATAKLDQTVNGTVTSGSLESHVLACHLRSGAMCSASDVAALEAQRSRVTYSGGTIRSHFQGFYFTCPEFLANPDGSVTGIEQEDGGTPLDAGVGSASFPLIQNDVDFVGCATGGCHEQRTQPGQLHLYFRPSTAEELTANYQAVLPWTSGDDRNGNPVPGGRFVNEAPLPADIRARWMDWISNGTPY